MPAILVIDDEEYVLKGLSRVLGKLNYTVYTAATGEEGVACFRRNHVDLVILDICLPDGDGIDVFKRLAALDRTVKVVFVSGSEYAGHHEAALSLGALAFLPKPFYLDDILGLVTKHVA